MRVISWFAAVLATSSSASAAALRERQSSEYAGYLISTFSDPNPAVQMYLSNGNSPSNYTFLNGAQPVLASTVGTRGVRDIYLTSNSARTQWYIIATGKL